LKKYKNNGGDLMYKLKCKNRFTKQRLNTTVNSILEGEQIAHDMGFAHGYGEYIITDMEELV